MTYSERELSAV